MAEWKKVVVSGSSAELSSLTLDTALAVAQGGTGLNTGNLSGQAGKSLSVNVGETGFTFADASAPSGTISSSAQVKAALPSGTVSGSVQIDGASITTNTVGFGGVSVALGSTDDTPAFNLADATGYTGDSSLVTVGTVTNGDVSAILPSGTVSGSATQARTQISAQESNQKLTDIAGLAVTDGNIIVGDGTNFVAESGATARTSLGLGSADSVTFGNLTISNDLTVQGTASFESTENLKVADRFIALASGSGAAGDGGIVIEQSTAGGGQGQVFGFDNANGGRWGLVSGFNPTASAFTPSDLMVTATTSTSAPATAPNYGGSAGGAGNIHVDTNTNGGEIYIYV